MTQTRTTDIRTGDRVRIEGDATYLWGMTGTVVSVESSAVAVVQLDQSTGVGVPAGFPAGAPYRIDADNLVHDYSGDDDERHPDDETITPYVIPHNTGGTVYCSRDGVVPEQDTGGCRLCDERGDTYQSL